MEALLKYLPSVKSMLALAAFCGIIVFGFKDTLASVALAGDNDAFSLLLFFLLFFVVGVLGLAVFHSIGEGETQKDIATSTNTAKLKSVKKSGIKQKGTGNTLDADDVEDTTVEQDSNETATNSDDKKKA